MKRAYQFRIYPNKNQEVKLNRTLDTCRHLYNDSLSKKKHQAELNKLFFEFQVFSWGKPEWISYEDQSYELTSSRTPEQKEVHSQVLQNVLKRLDKSFKNFNNGFGYPRFKGRNRYNSFTYPQSGFELENGKLRLSKLGRIRIIIHRKIEGIIKTCTIKKDVDQWYAVFTTEIENKIEPTEVKTKIGVDVGLISLLTLSNGEKIEPPKFLRKSEKILAKEQIRLSRKIRNQRKDFAHKTSNELVNRFDLIAFENLKIQNMVKNRHLAKSIMDAGWYQLKIFTKYKAEDAGKLVEFCIAKGTSQTCHICGNRQKIELKDRVFRCSVCGNIEDRDVNASNNVLNRCTAGIAGIEACKSGLA